jgi:hypothetical protein
MRVQGGGLPVVVGMTRALEARMGPGPEGLTELFKLLAEPGAQLDHEWGRVDIEAYGVIPGGSSGVVKPL